MTDSGGSRKEWGLWAKFTASALAGACTTLVVLTLSWAEVRHQAEAGDSRSRSNRDRLDMIERQSAADSERWKSTNEKLGDMKKLLEKLVDRK